MSTAPAVEPVQPGLSEPQRLIDAYIAPSKTFLDIRQNASWWLPFIVSLLVAGFFTYSVQSKVGWSTVAQQQVQKSRLAREQIEKLPADQQQVQMEKSTERAKVFSWIFPIFSLVFAAIVAGLFMMTCNFGLGAREPYKRYFAIWMFGTLPMLFKYLAAAILLWTGGGGDNFDLNNPVGTNVGYYMPAGTAVWLRTLLDSVDVFTIWSVVLLALGLSIVARISRGAATAVVLGWWGLAVLIGVAGAALTS